MRLEPQTGQLVGLEPTATSAGAVRILFRPASGEEQGPLGFLLRPGPLERRRVSRFRVLPDDRAAGHHQRLHQVGRIPPATPTPSRTCASWSSTARRWCSQDDSGVPLRFFTSDRWTVDLYGHYEDVLAAYKDWFQPDLAAAFQRQDKVLPLPFAAGYQTAVIGRLPDPRQPQGGRRTGAAGIEPAEAAGEAGWRCRAGARRRRPARLPPAGRCRRRQSRAGSDCAAATAAAVQRRPGPAAHLERKRQRGLADRPAGPGPCLAGGGRRQGLADHRARRGAFAAGAGPRPRERQNRARRRGFPSRGLAARPPREQLRLAHPGRRRRAGLRAFRHLRQRLPGARRRPHPVEGQRPAAGARGRAGQLADPRGTTSSSSTATAPTATTWWRAAKLPGRSSGRRSAASSRNASRRTRRRSRTPIVALVEGRPQLISTGAAASTAYDPRTGEEIW